MLAALLCNLGSVAPTPPPEVVGLAHFPPNRAGVYIGPTRGERHQAALQRDDREILLIVSKFLDSLDGE